MNDFRSRFIFCIISLAFLVGCHSDVFEDVPVVDDVPEVKPAFEILSDNKYCFEEFVQTLLNESSMIYSLPDVQKVLVAAVLNTYIYSLASDEGIMSNELYFRRVTYLYTSVDQYGSERELSAMALWLGTLSGDAWKDFSPDRVCLMEHFTITADAECPSIGYPLEAFINGNSLVIMPDYIGYGATADMVHPYMNHELCAANSIDALEAGFKLFGELSQAEMASGWTTVVAGASQGAGNALAIHKYMDTHSEVSDQWNFSHSYSVAGPYSPSLTVDLYLEEGTTENPVLLALTMKSIYDSYPEILGKFDENRLYSDKFLAHKEELDAALSSKKYSTSELNELYYSRLRTDDETLSAGMLRLEDILSDELMDKESQICRALYECLGKNDLVKGWTPVHPIKLYCSDADSIVPAENSLAVLDAFGEDNVTLENVLFMDHILCCALWMLDIMNNNYKL